MRAINGFLKILLGGLELAETIMGKSEIVVGPEGSRSKADGFFEVGNAGLDLALLQKFGALLECVYGLAGHAEFACGDHVGVAVGGGLRGRDHRVESSRKNKEQES